MSKLIAYLAGVAAFVGAIWVALKEQARLGKKLGKTEAENDVMEDTLDDVEAAARIRAHTAGMSDADIAKRLSDHWTRDDVRNLNANLDFSRRRLNRRNGPSDP